MGLRPCWYRWLSDPDAASEPGFFAQQVHCVFRWAVTKGKGRPGGKGFKPWQLDQGKLIPVVIAQQQDLVVRSQRLVPKRWVNRPTQSTASG
jgi:hypothetical protein